MQVYLIYPETYDRILDLLESLPVARAGRLLKVLESISPVDMTLQQVAPPKGTGGGEPSKPN